VDARRWEFDGWEVAGAGEGKFLVRLRFVDDPAATEAIEEWDLCPLFSAHWPKDWLVRRVETLGYSDHGEPTYILDVREAKSSWGVELSSLQIVMDVWVGLLGSAAWEGFRSLSKDLASQARAKEGFAGWQFDEYEVENRAIWMLSERYRMSEEQVRTISMEYDGRHASCEFDGPDGTLYNVELDLVDGLIVLWKVRRRLAA
jgi:hypothetical protein